MFSNVVKYATQTALVILLGIAGLCVFHVHVAQAATLYITPASSQVSVGNILSVKVLVATDGKVINNTEGTLQYSPDLLEIVSVSKDATIFSLWVDEPKFSNNEGQLSFNGGLPNPGFTGQSGQIVTVVFKAKKVGTATVLFGDSAVRANDGLGTDILTAKQAATVSIQVGGEQIIPPVITKPVVENISAPVITSVTHPDQGEWYAVQDAQLSWEVPNDVTAVSTLMSRTAGTPTVVYDPPIANRKVDGLEDGVWYFNARYKNKKGWGAVAHFKVQVDTVAPNPFKIAFSKSNDVNDIRPIASFVTTDATSGIAYYEVKIDNGPLTKVTNRDARAFVLENQDPGKHTLFVRALDYAHNETIQTAEFTIASIEMPKITQYPTEVRRDETVIVKGTAQPEIDVEIMIADALGRTVSNSVTVTSNGTFTMVWPKNLEGGVHTLTARSVDKRGAKSDFTSPVSFVVRQSLFESIGTFILNWLSLVIILASLIGGAVWGVIHLVHKNTIMKKMVRKDIHAAETTIHHAFELLRENVRDQIKTLEKARTKRSLTKEEEKVIKQLSENLTKAEEYVQKQITDIEEKI